MLGMIGLGIYFFWRVQKMLAYFRPFYYNKNNFNGFEPNFNDVELFYSNNCNMIYLAGGTSDDIR